MDVDRLALKCFEPGFLKVLRSGATLNLVDSLADCYKMVVY
jgi:hypothetical protein